MFLNVAAVVLAASNHWPYARRRAGTFVLGNLQLAILVRNELFGRILYLVVNTLFAKVSAPSTRSAESNICRSGPRSGLGAVALQHCNIWAAYILDVP
jgi:hypothetical protein